MDVRVYTGKELKEEIKTDFILFSDRDMTVAEWYGSEYEGIKNDKYYLVSSELVIHEESESPQITSDGVLYKHGEV
ncbi:hypothetical protein [Carnobacterium maltaromaticum]|uniref:hypothetical protein n=1 Tax=Carnobacterium maltaromaticum TaxID=2751 RepID=UPI00191BB914|nr:hypothetical protein [Carnobacterium maltaromaticum]CAD5903016.1 hypothetical protein CMALT394_60038 [Carnobacterium maltaromaticum]